MCSLQSAIIQQIILVGDNYVSLFHPVSLLEREVGI